MWLVAAAKGLPTKVITILKIIPSRQKDSPVNS